MLRRLTSPGTLLIAGFVLMVAGLAITGLYVPEVVAPDRTADRPQLVDGNEAVDDPEVDRAVEKGLGMGCGLGRKVGGTFATAELALHRVTLRKDTLRVAERTARYAGFINGIEIRERRLAVRWVKIGVVCFGVGVMLAILGLALALDVLGVKFYEHTSALCGGRCGTGVTSHETQALVLETAPPEEPETYSFVLGEPDEPVADPEVDPDQPLELLLVAHPVFQVVGSKELYPAGGTKTIESLSVYGGPGMEVIMTVGKDGVSVTMHADSTAEASEDAA